MRTFQISEQQIKTIAHMIGNPAQAIVPMVIDIFNALPDVTESVACDSSTPATQKKND